MFICSNVYIEIRKIIHIRPILLKLRLRDFQDRRRAKMHKLHGTAAESFEPVTYLVNKGVFADTGP